MSKTVDTLNELGVASRLEVASAHRTPERVRELVASGDRDGVCVYICAAGMAAHLAGTVAAHTTRPVIGVPLAGSTLFGFDSLLSTVQMPRGVPVATVAIGEHGAVNAAILAAQILAVGDPALAERVAKRRAG
ncbi:MAG: 5-(carboxyamino)imidazole ribonucleotide mutase [candidate division Zixibacteria bacterium]|nr:5-(carboxyamino)imidazole ribonucleotide mutase [candidate division Zixibacteria bacterium]